MMLNPLKRWRIIPWAQWTMHQWVRLIAGTIILISLMLAAVVHPYWLLLTAFVGCNLLQSAFTNWCPLMVILRRFGVQQ